MVLNPAPARPLPPGLLACADLLVPNEIAAGALARPAVPSVGSAAEAGPQDPPRAEGGAPNAWIHLVEMDGFVADGDARLAAIAAKTGVGVSRAEILGGYAVPIGAAELSGGITGGKG